jgi:uncharacterized membrane protein
MGWYTVYFSRLTMDIHAGYGTSGYDFGLYDQGLWLLSHFKDPFVTIMGRNLFGDHTSFIMLLLVPFYWVYPNANVLLVGQSVLLALAAVPVYLLARHRLGSTAMATVLAAAYLLHPALGWSNLESFHPDVFLPVLVGAALYGAIRWRPWLLITATVLALLVKEDVALVAVPLGVWVALRRNRRIGLRIALGSVGYALFATEVVIRSFLGVPTLNAWRIPFGGVHGLVSTVLRQPRKVADYLTSEQRPYYVWQMYFPTGLLLLAAPDVTLIGVLALGSNVISTFVYQHLLQYHYTLILLPVLAMATVMGVSALPSPRWQRAGLWVVALSALWSCYLWGAAPFSVHKVPHWHGTDPRVADIEAVRSHLPPNVVVSAFYSYVPHVDHRERVYMYPTPFKAELWSTYKQEGQPLAFAGDVQYLFLPTYLDAGAQSVFDSIKDQFQLVDRQGDSALYRRIAAPPGPPGVP